jgi:NAD(P)-dependent dehydrogenase (short-subunit alcohol dehydrogenase family)
MDRACEGRAAIVTGASRGIGAAIARRLAEEGARVVVSARTVEPDGRNQGSLREVVEEINKAGGEAVAVRCDLSSAEERQALVREAVERVGPVDILVNNAAVTFMYPFEEFPEKRFRLMFEVQVRAPYELAQLVVPSMKARHGGAILNITSRAANHPYGPPFDPFHTSGVTVYGMVKAALDRFSTALAVELRDAGIAVNALAPWDNVATPGAGHHDLLDDYPIEGDEWIAEAALALCSTPGLTGRVAYSQPLLAEMQRLPKRPG